MRLAVFLLFLPMVLGDSRKNVLFLISDDLRPNLGCYKGTDYPSKCDPLVHSPNIDKLARESLLLKRAYVQVSICSPSRSSFLTGRRPDTIRVYDLVTDFRKTGGANVVTIPQYFKQNGYTAVSIGKIFHPSIAASRHGDPQSWTEKVRSPENDGYLRNNTGAGPYSWKAVPKSIYNSHPLQDTLIATDAIQTLQRLSTDFTENQHNFFLAVGFRLPHLPFVFPEKFLKLYPRNQVKLPDNRYAPVGMPPIAWTNYHELRGKYDDVIALDLTGELNTTLPDGLAMDLRRAYFAAVSYMDEQLGRVLDELQNLGLSDDTVVVFLGDHGWQLGEHAEWCKFTNFEIAAHAPLMIKVPGLTESGIQSEALTEFVDIFPTVVEAAGLHQVPECSRQPQNEDLCHEGRTLMPLVQNPNPENWRKAALSQYLRDLENGTLVMGYSIRTDLFRYTEWPEVTRPPRYKANWNKLYGVELYDHLIDPDENLNQANNAEYKKVKADLSMQLRTLVEGKGNSI